MWNHEPPSRADLLAARDRLLGVAHATPVLTCATLDRMAGARLFFKCENLQRVGAFKFRGAFNALAATPEEERGQGVVTHSSGNHAQALALAARLFGVPATIVMPRDAPAVKIDAVRGYGAEVVFCEPTPAAREAAAAEAVTRTGGMLVHPFDDARVIAGQSTVAQELLGEVAVTGPLEFLLTPIGGGGLTSGTALAAHHFFEGARVIACEPAQVDDACRSFASGRLEHNERADTLADGLRTSLSPLTFGIVRTHVHDIRTVSEEEIVAAMRLVWERMKIVIEPSAAVTVAVALRGLGPGNPRVGVILSGGNVDLDHLPWLQGKER
jgi:threonine dehydratase